MSSLWIVIIIIGVATYAMRVVPLLWVLEYDRLNLQAPWLGCLGPCVLTAMATAVILPMFLDAKTSFEVTCLWWAGCCKWINVVATKYWPVYSSNWHGIYFIY